MTVIGIKEFPRLGIPHLSCAVAAPRDDTIAMVRPIKRGYSIGMTFIGVGVAAIAGVPHLYGLVIPCRSKALAIRCPSDNIHLGRMSCVREEEILVRRHS